jgi:hypothetical protein
LPIGSYEIVGAGSTNGFTPLSIAVERNQKPMDKLSPSGNVRTTCDRLINDFAKPYATRKAIPHRHLIAIAPF